VAAPRFFVEDGISAAAVGHTLALPPAVAHHAMRVVRLAVGDAVTLFTGQGGEYAATIVDVDKRATTVRIDAFDAVERESPLAVTLAQAHAAADAMDYAVRKATELGVAAIQPVVCERSARLAAGERAGRRLAHWRQVAVAACEQCGRNRVPHVAEARPLTAWLREWRTGGAILAPEGARPLRTLAMAPTALLVGPEGGFTAREIDAARAADFVAVRLGPRVLRTETAGVAALAAINALWGDWQ
jgi:16S rRNA (uracil1498-N3)-methyltransferase